VWCGQKFGPWDRSNWADVSCHAGCSASSGLGHSRISEGGSMMKRVRFDAFDDLAV